MAGLGVLIGTPAATLGSVLDDHSIDTHTSSDADTIADTATPLAKID